MMFGDCWVGWMYRADVDECPHQRYRLSTEHLCSHLNVASAASLQYLF